MPIEEVNKMDVRYAAVREALRPRANKSEICDNYHISRPTLDKWIRRIFEGGYPNLQDRSSRPHSSPHKTPDDVIELILKLNKNHWGADLIRKNLIIKHPGVKAPAKSTIQKILESNGCSDHYNKRRKFPHPGKPYVDPQYPNHFWTLDYKGKFKTLDGIYCSPLTIRCPFSGMLLCTEPHIETTYLNVKRTMERVFREYGLPEYILSDNGVPFATNGFEGLSQLNIWWTEIGITHIRMQPSSPQQNPAHERMHREMKRRCTRPPESNIILQAKRLEQFRYDYNYELAVGDNENPPAEAYELSARKFPEVIKEPEYPKTFEVRLVSKNGGFRWNSKWVPLTHAMEKKYIGLEEIDDGLWKVWFYDRFLGFMDEQKGRIEDSPDRFIRW